MAVSSDALGYSSVGSMCRLKHALTSARSKGTRKFSPRASAIHLPDDLIHSKPFSLIEVLPVLAWVRSASLPILADSSSSGLSSRSWDAVISLLIHSPTYGTTRSSSSTGGGVFLLFRASPIVIEALKIAPTGRIPPNLCAAMAAKPIEATHPHDPQSGLPPN